MRLVIGHDPFFAAWVQARIPQMAGLPGGFGPCTAIGVAHGDVVVGACVYHGYQPRFGSIEMSFASVDPRWLIGPAGERKAIIRGLMGYPFDQLKVGRVSATTPKKNRAARRFIDKFGFKREGVARRGFGDDDAILSGLLESEWRASNWARP
jgi:RimJ/RimL family protein N-acetyltransferase